MISSSGSTKHKFKIGERVRHKVKTHKLYTIIRLIDDDALSYELIDSDYSATPFEKPENVLESINDSLPSRKRRRVVLYKAPAAPKSAPDKRTLMTAVRPVCCDKATQRYKYSNSMGRCKKLDATHQIFQCAGCLKKYKVTLKMEGKKKEVADTANEKKRKRELEALTSASSSSSSSSRMPRPTNASGYWGVRLTGSKRYRATLRQTHNKDKNLGTYDTAEEAAKVYDAAAVELGKTNLNFPNAASQPKKNKKNKNNKKNKKNKKSKVVHIRPLIPSTKIPTNKPSTKTNTQPEETSSTKNSSILLSETEMNRYRAFLWCDT